MFYIKQQSSVDGNLMKRGIATDHGAGKYDRAADARIFVNDRIGADAGEGTYFGMSADIAFPCIQ